MCVCMCLRFEDPPWELLQRCPFAFSSGSGIEFYYYVMEQSLLHTLIPPLWLAQAPTRDVSAGRWQVGRAAPGCSREALGEALPGTEAGSASLQKSGRLFGPVFIERGQKTLSEHVVSSAQMTEIAYF